MMELGVLLLMNVWHGVNSYLGDKIMKSNNQKGIEEVELQLGKYLEDDMLELSEGDETHGGTTPALSVIASAVSAFISTNTCPTTSCTRAC